MSKWRKGPKMAKRRRLEAPGAAELADLEAGFAAKPLIDKVGFAAPIAQIAGEIARATEPLETEKRVSMARDSVDAEAWRLAQQEGRVVQDIPLGLIVLDHMMRDRMVVDRADIDELKFSIRTNGLRLPIEVLAIEDGKYGLISGWRRVTALQELQAEGLAGFDSIKAFVRPPYEAAALYTAMVEENELRAQITPYERGRIAVMAAELGAFAGTEAAIETIFAAASKAKRSKIRSFAYVHEQLGDMLHYPTELSERNGLRLAYALREGFGDQIRHLLIATANTSAAFEWARIEPIVAAAEAVERAPERGGRPRKQFDKSLGKPQPLNDRVTMERVLHEDGYSIRLRGTAVDAEMIDLLMGELLRRLGTRQVQVLEP
jgi:ParB family transcriptional regulator, chromosome partitioning protein